MTNTEPEFVSLALDQIRPSPRNPRKTFDAAALDQLAASIAAKGVLLPILVRPRTLWHMCCGFVASQKKIMDGDGTSFGLAKGQFEGAGIKFEKGQYDEILEKLIDEGRAESPHPGSVRPAEKALDQVSADPLGLGIDHYELIAGERRWRASAIAGKEMIPALCRDLSDHDAAEIRVIENDQREDVPPLEQAEGYADLIAMGDDVEGIATKIGRPAKYVAARLTLTKLIDPLKTMMRAGELPFGHAHLLARLPAAEQVAIAGADGGDLGDYDGHIISVADLKRLIRQEYVGVLDSAPWKLDDEALVPTAGSCTRCPKRSSANPTLFDELIADAEVESGKKVKGKVTKPDHCTDRTCYAGKKTAFIELQIRKTAERHGAEPLKVSATWRPQAEGVLGLDRYEESDAKTAKTDPTVKPAVCTDGEHAGKVIYVRERKPSTAAADPAWAKEEAERRKKAKAENAARIEALGIVVNAMIATSEPWALLTPVIRATARVVGNEVCKWVADRRGLPKAENSYEQDGRIEAHSQDLETDAERHALIAELIAGKFAQFQWMNEGSEWFWDAFGVDRVALVEEFVRGGERAEEVTAKRTAKKPAKAKAKAKKKQKAGTAS